MTTVSEATPDVCHLWPVAGFLESVLEFAPTPRQRASVGDGVSERRGGRWAASRGGSESLRRWESRGEGLCLAAGARLSCHMTRALRLGGDSSLVAQSRASPKWRRSWAPPERVGAERRAGASERQFSPRGLPSRPSRPRRQRAATSAPCWGSQAGTCFLGPAFCCSPAPSPPRLGLRLRLRRANAGAPTQTWLTELGIQPT